MNLLRIFYIVTILEVIVGFAGLWFNVSFWYSLLLFMMGYYQMFILLFIIVILYLVRWWAIRTNNKSLEKRMNEWIP